MQGYLAGSFEKCRKGRPSASNIDLRSTISFACPTRVNPRLLVNPWLDLPQKEPYVLASDSDAIDTYNRHVGDAFRVQTRMLPEPFIGRLDAPLVLLSLNPGFDPGGIAVHANPEFQSLIRGNYSQERMSYPFYLLDPAPENPGRGWWEQKLRPLLTLFSRELIARSVLCIEHFPYASYKYHSAVPSLGSQEFGFQLARAAISRGATIVIMRASRLWRTSVRELNSYSLVFELNSAQNVTISTRNCPGFDAVVSAIRNGNSTES